VNERFTWVAPFVAQLTRLANPDDVDRAALAHLRRGLIGAPDYTLARVGWLFRGVHDDEALDAAILAAGLFAWVKGECHQNDGANFGRAFGCNLTDDAKAQREKRFTDLLDTDRTDLPAKLRQAVTLIARDRVGLDWKMLIYDLTRWDRPDRWVQREWARGFWSNPKDETPAEEPAATA